MNKWAYLLCGIGLVAGIFLITRVSRPKSFDRTISYSPKTFRPYDTRFFFLTLKKNTRLATNTRIPGGKRFSGTGKTYVVCSPYFLPDVNEKNKILQFVSQGNTLLLSSFDIAPHFLKTLNIQGQSLIKPLKATDDSLKIVWNTGESWAYPGSAAGPGLLLSSSHPAQIVASDGRRFPALIRISYGKGTIWLQNQPMAFSNYFLLHKNNSTYLDRIMEELNLSSATLIWDNYYPDLKSAADRKARQKSNPPEGKSFFVEMVRRHPPLQWAVFTFLAGTLLFVFNYARRLRQPAEQLPDTENTSLEFTKAIAGLYRENKDNAAIAQKIRLQLQDHLLNAYKIPAHDLTPENAGAISRKTGKPPEDITRLAELLPRLQEKVSDKTLTEFYRLVYKFIYK